MKTIRFAAVCAAIASTPALAQDVDFSLDYGLGIEYDGNVIPAGSIPLTEEADAALQLDAGAKVVVKTGDGGQVQLRYNYTTSRFFDVSQNDTSRHVVTGALVQPIGKARLGAVVSYGDVNLDGGDFMDFVRANPFVIIPAGNGSFRLAYAFMDKNFDGLAFDRGAQSHDVSAAYTFKAGPGRLTFGGTYRSENADIRPDLSYDGFTLQTGYRARAFTLADKPVIANIGVEYEKRDYEGINFLIFAPRDDERFSVKSGLDWRLSRKMRIGAEASYRDVSSNLPSADLDEFGFALRFSHSIL